MRKICMLTGSRADYTLAKPIIDAIKSYHNLELALIVTGMHLSDEFGRTIDEIKEDGIEITASVKMNPESDTNYSMITSISKGIIRIANALRKIKPNIFLVIGDRIEALAGTIAAAFLNITIAHICGGDKTKGGLDESVRHAITKFAHFHFPSNEESANRIKKMGEDPLKIFIVGTPQIDSIIKTPLLSKDQFQERFGVKLDKPLITLIQHTVTTEISEAKYQIIETLEAIKELEIQTIVIYPNSDAGGREIIKQIKKYESLQFVTSYKNLGFKDFYSLLKYSSVMVGNSSSGITEAALFKLPVINIGIRQKGRLRSTNVIDVSHNRDKIIKAIKIALFDKIFKKEVANSKNLYGEGNAGEKIASILSKLEINEKLTQKEFFD